MDNMMIELCWFITTNCNKRCAFCHSFITQPKELPYVGSADIASNLIKAKVRSVTISGGEPMLYSNICDIVKNLYCHGVSITMISNGYKPERTNVFRYLEEIVFSLDSVDSGINELIGRGPEHHHEVFETIKIARGINPKIRVRINSLVCKTTIGFLNDVGSFLCNNNITKWRLFKFAALRGKSKINQDKFQISDTDYLREVTRLRDVFPDIEIQTRYTTDFETMYLLILPNGDVIRTLKQDDQIIGNILVDDLNNLIKTLYHEDTSNFRR